MTDISSSDARSPFSNVSDSGSAHRSRSAAFQPDEFRHLLSDCDWTDEQKDEFIRELWKIVQGFVETGLGVHPIQQALRVRKTLDHVGDDVVASPGISDIDVSQTAALADTPALAKEDS